jgi:hypothetical protein
MTYVSSDGRLALQSGSRGRLVSGYFIGGDRRLACLSVCDNSGNNERIFTKFYITESRYHSSTFDFFVKILEKNWTLHMKSHFFCG